jgi:uncharacterized damage-inducible protein DinB
MIGSMPGQVAPVTDERELLLAYLTQQRYVLKLTAHGLTDEQSRQSSPPSSLTVGGLIKHVSQVERYWIDLVVQRQADVDAADTEYEDNFKLAPGETLASVIDAYDAVARETEAVIGKIADLGQAVPVPSGVPWFPDDVEAWTVRWVLLHLITETARHAGHADIVREAVDGATAFPLMAAAEGWPATEWLQPWSPNEA